MPRNERVQQICEQIEEARQFLGSSKVQEASAAEQAISSRVEGVKTACDKVEQALQGEPVVDIAFVGQSRGGKSTLINSITGHQILETSATRPCSAAIVKLLYAELWSVEITFVTKEAWEKDLKEAIEEAENVLAGGSELSPDESKYFKDVLERFVELFEIAEDLSPVEKLDRVKSGKLPSEFEHLLGQTPPIENVPFERLKKMVADYLSTSKNYWTVVDQCVIRGPFEDWHPNLCVVDLPGTNDANAHRSMITDRVRYQADAVGIVTQQSNLGDDIESWLRESRVLTDFIESADADREHLFIIRTQLDNFVPQFHQEVREDEETRLCQQAISDYKAEQTEEFHKMLKQMVAPVIDSGSNIEIGDGDAVQQKRQELLKRVGEVPVHFVSALAHEVFEGRANVLNAIRQVMEKYFDRNSDHTGVPGLRAFMNQMATDYLEKNFYADISRRIDSELQQLKFFFETRIGVLEANKKGAGKAVRALTDHVKHEIIPWVNDEVKQTVTEFDRTGKEGEEAIRHRLHQSWQLSDRRFQDKIDKWSQVAWSSLRAMARKGGRHTTVHGKYLDVSNDICSILVDDLLLVWTAYRDHIIQKQVSRATQDFSAQLVEKLGFAKSQIDNPEAQDAIDVIVAEIVAIADLQREKLLRKVDQLIKKLESIKKPAYQFIQKSFGDVFNQILQEAGSGCQERMRGHLIKGINDKLPSIREHINGLIDERVGGLLEHCSSALEQFGAVSKEKMEITVIDIEQTQKEQDLNLIEQKKERIKGVIKLFPPRQAS